MSRYRKTFTEALQEVSLSEKQITKLKNGVKVLGNALPNKALAQNAANKANKEMGHDADVYQSPFNNRFYVRIKEENLNEKDHEVSMARGELEAISDKALKLSSMLQGKSDEGNPLEAWVQSKITKAKDYINSVADYMEFNPDMAMEKFDMKQYKKNEDENEHSLNALQLVKMFGTPVEKKEMQGIYDRHMKRGHITPIDLRARDKLNSKYYSKLKEEVEEELTEIEDYGLRGKITDRQLDNLKKVWAKKTMKDVTPGIKKMLKDMDAPTRAAVANAGINVISKIVPEAVEIDEAFSNTQISMLKKAYDPLKGARISTDNADKLSAIIKKVEHSKDALEKLVKADIPFVSDIAISKLISKHNYKADKLKSLKASYMKEEGDDAEKERLEKEIAKKDDQINVLKQKHEVDKARAMKQVTDKLVNPETGEPLLQVGIAYKHMKDKMAKDKAAGAERKNENTSYPPKEINKKKHQAYSDPKKGEKEIVDPKPKINEGAKLTFESIAVVKKKAEQTGMPYSVLKQVYDRGMAAWKGGHRPGATQVQWALARVNSFVTKSSGTWGGADKDLAAKVKGSK